MTGRYRLNPNDTDSELEMLDNIEDILESISSNNWMFEDSKKDKKIREN